MNSFFGIIIFISFNLLPFAIYSQNLVKAKVLKSDKMKGVLKQYKYHSEYDGSINLYLYKNKTYKYTINSANYLAFSEGKWSINDGLIYLTSNIIDTAVEVQILNLSNENLSKTPFLIPVNLKGDQFSEARIYVNNDSSYCFPFFDTCVGNYSLIERIKIEFGNGFRSKWMKLVFNEGNRIQLVVQTEYILSSYLRFNTRRYKIDRSKIELIFSE